MYYSLTLESGEQAKWLASHPVLDGNRHQVTTEDGGFTGDGRRVVISSDALEVLGTLDPYEDGYYDGRSVWIGGTDYPTGPA